MTQRFAYALNSHSPKRRDAMHNPYLHDCCECGEQLDELDLINGKPTAIYDDGGWFCRECWNRMDAERDRETESAA